MADMKHVGRIVKTGKKCIVVFRTLPGDAFNCLIVLTESLSESYHDALIGLVDSNAAQDSNELSEVLARAVFPDGSTMLPSLHVKGLLIKVPTDAIEMIPNSKMTIPLSELNQLIAEQMGMSVQDLAMKDNADKTEIKEIATAKDISPDTVQSTDIGKTTSSSVNETANMDPDQLAKKYRSDADKLSKEAAQLRRLAEELVPTKKKVAIKE
jgi:hypothetical protein